MKKILKYPFTFLKYIFLLWILFLVWESIGVIHQFAKFTINYFIN